MLDDSLAESQAEWGAANAEYNANIQRLQQHTEALQQKTDSSLTLHKYAERLNHSIPPAAGASIAYKAC